MPLTFFKGDIFSSTKPANRVGASSTFLSIEIAEAVKAVSKFIPGCKALPGQLLLASSAYEALLMPRLLSVSHSSCSNGLLALYALHSKLLLITGYTEVLIVFRDEALCSDWLLAPQADEAGLMPAAALIFHFPSPWHDRLLAFNAFRGVLIGVAFSAEQMLLLCSKGLVHQ